MIHPSDHTFSSISNMRYCKPLNDARAAHFMRKGYFKLVFCYILFQCSPVHAQGLADIIKGNISGIIADSLTGQPIEYATVGLIEGETNKTINGITSDDKGAFVLKNLAAGTYNLQIYFIGYKSLTLKKIILSKNKPNINLGSIMLTNTQSTLKEITVVTEKSVVENKIDKLVYNTEKDLSSQGGFATDILRRVPQISVDVNGNVEVQGNANIRFLINGKPSSMFGNNIADVLQSIPANQIQSIEVITSPGAKYDAEGGSIINIILKKNTSKGFNASVATTAGTRLENGAINISARKNKFGANAFFNGNAQLASTTLNHLQRNNSDELLNQYTSLTQEGSSKFERRGFQTGCSFDWVLTGKDNLSAGMAYNDFYNNTNGSNNREVATSDSTGSLLSDVFSSLYAINRIESKIMDLNLNYKHSFKQEGQELELLISSSSGTNTSYFKQSQQTLSHFITSGSYGNNPGNDAQTNVSLNYTHPALKDFTIETGVKATISKLSSTSDVYLLNSAADDYFYSSSQSSSLTYNRTVYATYVSGTFKLWRVLDIKSGCRYEYTETNAGFSGVGSVVIKPYNTVVPSVTVARSFKKSQSLKFSYSKRISRPGFRDVNPFVNASDPKNLSTGNPNVKPEYSENFELGYGKIFDKGTNINVAYFFRGNYQDIQPYSRYYENYVSGDSSYRNVTVSSRENIGTEYNTGINLFLSVPVSSKFSIRSNSSVYYRSIKSIYSDGSINGYMYRVNLTASYSITKMLSAEVFGNFNSPRINAQGVQPSFTTYNLAVRQLLFKRNGSIALTATNPFHQYVPQKTELTGINFTTISTLQLPYRSFGINFTYKFGKMEFKKQKELEDVNLTNPSAPGN